MNLININQHPNDEKQTINFSDIIQAEKNILSALIYEYSLVATTDLLMQINYNIFETEYAKKIFLSIKNLETNKITVNISTVTNELKSFYKVNDPQLIKNIAYLSSINPGIFIFSLADEIKILQTFQLKKRIDQLCLKIKNTNVTIDSMQYLSQEWVRNFEELTANQLQKTYLTANDVVQDYENLVSQALADNNISDRFLKTGYAILNRKIKGLIGGQLLILAARPGVGKTTFALNILMNNLNFLMFNANPTNSNKRAIGLFSLEMNQESLLEKMIAIHANILLNDVKKPLEGLLLSEDKKRLINLSMDQIRNSNILFCDRSDITINEIIGLIKSWNREYDLKLVIVDYLQLINVTRDQAPSNYSAQQKIALISRNLKTLANDLDIPILALAQLNRKSEERKSDDREPVLSDLRESGSIEQDADIVMFLYQNDKNTSSSDENQDNHKNYLDPEITLKIGKNRHGEVGQIKFIFHKATGRFDDVI
ncbi:Replicative DNA helicase DnaB [[Mycoplasma] cavipharyngis]|uniref:replicative DNA helicase n=1 Tax=[Mycoplasma] cavipharyngis TaxID=92757 RepID=UPI00370472ED